MTDIGKRKFIRLATFSALTGASSMLIGCEDKAQENKTTVATSTPKGKESDKESVSNLAISEQNKTKAQPLKIGFVYIGPIGDGGWTYSHERGRQHIQNVFGDKIETTYVESVNAGPDSERVFRNMVDAGNQLIFGTTFGYMEYIERVALDHPDIYFEHCTGYKTGANLRVYDHRLYEAAYEAGIVAAYMSKSKVLGFVGTFPIAEVLRNVNGFTLGARSVEPDIKVKLVWTRSWYDPAKETEAANALLNGGADILLQNTDSSAVLQAAAKHNAHGFGWDSDMEHYAPKAHLGSCTLNWGTYYEKAVNDVLNKTWKTGVNRWGAKEGLIEFIKVSDATPSDAKQRIFETQEGLKNGSMAIFKGPINDNTGTQRLAEGQTANDNWNNKVNFLVEGIDGTIS